MAPRSSLVHCEAYPLGARLENFCEAPWNKNAHGILLYAGRRLEEPRWRPFLNWQA
jgi:hypothetical protein